MPVDLKRQPQGKLGGRNSKPRKAGEAVCDMKGDFWDLDAAFLLSMKQISPGWCGGELPEAIMDELKNTGRYQAHGLELSAQPISGGKIALRIADH
ncbi:hypothetical protein [Amphritea sp.]|uniref:hypothetical protein n=1 Tax=Amphritea sp. TaxID=1872502 RepID=UPI003D128581